MGKYIIVFFVAYGVSAICRIIGLPEALAGWFSCMAFFYVLDITE